MPLGFLFLAEQFKDTEKMKNGMILKDHPIF